MKAIHSTETTASPIMPRGAEPAGPGDPRFAPTAAGARARTRLCLVAVVVFLFAGFVALGVWQLERRTWKLALIARVDQRVHAGPVDAPGPARWSAVNATDDEYRHVRLSGTLLASRATFVRAVTEYGRGYWAMVPLQTRDGTVVLVNRGYVAENAPSRVERAAARGPVEITGLLRVSEPRGSVLHDNEPERDRWYSRDVQAIARLRGLDRVAPYFVDADAAPADKPPEDGEPIGGLTVVAFRNDHLGYALTWFSLALLCAVAIRRLMVGRSSDPAL